MIPNLVPPPIWLPQGWSPNALGPTPFGAGSVLGSGFIFFSQVLITNAQLNTLNVTPVTITSAPTDNSLVWPIWSCVEVLKTIASGGPSTTLSIRHGNLSGGGFDLCLAMNTDLANARSFFTEGIAVTGNYVTPVTTTIRNKPIVVLGSAAGPFGGSDATARVTIAFFKFASGY